MGVTGALGGVDGAEAGVLQHAIEAGGSEPRLLQGRGIEQIGLQPLQPGAIGTMPPAGLLQGQGTEIKAHRVEPGPGEQGHLMAAAAARHQHPPRRPGSQLVVEQKALQGRRRLAQFPAITPLAVAPIPALGFGRGGGRHPELARLGPG